MNVTYLMGAGASAAAIPPVGDEFNRRFILFCKLLIDYCRSYADGKSRPFIERAVEELPKHYSVDTYARKLFFQNNDEYTAFKLLLSAYFLFEQMGGKNHELGITDNALIQDIYSGFPNSRKRLDPRYDVLYAALLDETKKCLPANIYFISWNYDMQFELSLSGFLNSNIYDAAKQLNVYPGLSGRDPNAVDKAHFLKLNGTAGLMNKWKDESPYQFDIPEGKFLRQQIEKILNDIEKILKRAGEIGYLSMLHFAWENKTEIDQARKKANEIFSKTNILIIIGYSFPLYNRKIDREILRNLQTPTRVPTVYLQIPDVRFEEISERFKTTTNYTGKMIHRKDLDQFFIPDEVI